MQQIKFHISKCSFFFSVLFFLFNGNSFAQSKFTEKTSELLFSHYNISKYDTNYVQRPEKKFIASFQPEISTVGITIANNDNEVVFENQLNTKIGVNFSFYGFNIGYKFKIRNTEKENKDFCIKYNGRSFGLGIDFCTVYDLSGKISIGDTLKMKIKNSGLNIKIFQLSSYYVWNNKKFAYPAAFDKSLIQMKKCGSMLFGATYTSAWAKKCDSSGVQKIDLQCAGLGAGYGYNFVTKKKKLLLHISAIPMFLFYEEKGFENDGIYHKMKYSHPEVTISSCFALIYNFGKRYFFSIDSSRYMTIVGYENNIGTTFSRQFSKISFGVRF
jgi:hypothetical protein